MRQTVEELADAAAAAVAALTQRRTFEEARAALNEAGMNRARQALTDALKRIADAQVEARAAADLAKRLNGAVDVIVAEVEWELDARFVQQGNKTLLVLDPADGTELPENLKPMTADERRDWKTREANRAERVRQARQLAQEADLDLGAAKDAVVLAEKAFSAARADLDAAITTARILADSLKADPR